MSKSVFVIDMNCVRLKVRVKRASFIMVDRSCSEARTNIIMGLIFFCYTTVCVHFGKMRQVRLRVRKNMK